MSEEPAWRSRVRSTFTTQPSGGRVASRPSGTDTAGAGFREYEPAEVEALVAERDATYRRLLRAAPADW